jgi:hypothetical protein
MAGLRFDLRDVDPRPQPQHAPELVEIRDHAALLGGADDGRVGGFVVEVPDVLPEPEVAGVVSRLRRVRERRRTSGRRLWELHFPNDDVALLRGNDAQFLQGSRAGTGITIRDRF